MYQAFYSLTRRFPPETIHWSSKLSPSIFICQPDSTTQHLFSWLSPCLQGGHVPPVLFPGGKWFQGSGQGGFLLCLPISSERVVAHEPAASTLTAPWTSRRLYSKKKKKQDKKKKDWWVALSRNVPGCVFKVNFLSYEKLLFFYACISLLQCQNFCCVKLFSCIAEFFSIK